MIDWKKGESGKLENYARSLKSKHIIRGIEQARDSKAEMWVLVEALLLIGCVLGKSFSSLRVTFLFSKTSGLDVSEQQTRGCIASG